MKVKLLRDARINHKAGEIVNVSPAECEYLVSTESAVVIKNAVKVAADPVEKKRTKTKK